ncbi:MAG: aromatic ring-hydroxylating dioxygenase subunit alpha [Gammaproteobacteria bacterium]|nr:aromatic ring-hydroxylating dioxygenase subunit alpha [Gammaproteobacteria bacterium]
MDKLTAQTIQQRLTGPIATVTGLPNERYTSDQAFIHDRDNVVGTGWACLSFVEDLAERNFARPIDFMGLPLVVTRDNQDNIRVFHNVCSHRGMELCDTPRKTNGMLRCPYHSWTYALDGQLRGTPHIGGYGVHEHPDFDRGAHGLKEVRSHVWLNALFINLSGDAPEFEIYAKPIIDRFNELGSEQHLKNFMSNTEDCRTTLTVQSNWKLAVENFLEAYHLPTVHPELNQISPLQEHYHIEEFDNGAGQGSRNYSRMTLENKHLPALAKWPTDKINLAEYPALYPNTFFGIHADQLFILYLQPVSAGETIEHVRISYVGEEALNDVFKTHRTRLLESWKSIFEEDIFAVERMQKGRASPGYRGGAFSPVMDGPTVHFHRWVAGRLPG